MTMKEGENYKTSYSEFLECYFSAIEQVESFSLMTSAFADFLLKECHLGENISGKNFWDGLTFFFFY